MEDHFSMDDHYLMDDHLSMEDHFLMDDHLSMEDQPSDELLSIWSSAEPEEPAAETAVAYIEKQLNTFEVKVLAPIILFLTCTIFACYSYCQRRKQDHLYEKLLFEAE